MTKLKHLLMILAILVPAFASAQAEVPDYSRLTAEHHPGYSLTIKNLKR